MPFTLAHPVAILPFSRCRYCHFPALVIGSLSPDFVYFLHGRAVSGGHGLADMLWPNLPLCFAVYWLYLALWRDTLSNFLPVSTSLSSFVIKVVNMLCFFLSCTNIKFNIYRLNNKHYFQFGNKLGFSEKDLRNPYNKDGKLNNSLIDLFLGHLAQLIFNDRNKYFRKDP